MRRQVACALAVALLAGSAAAAPVRFVLEPRTVTLGFTAYALGMVRIEGRFARFQGVLALDDQDSAACSVSLVAEAASLTMPSESMSSSAKGPALLDVAAFPSVRIDGACAGGALPAVMVLHGVTRPLTLAVTRSAGQWVAQATIDRNDWGMGALPFLAGPQVTISITAGLPP